MQKHSSQKVKTVGALCKVQRVTFDAAALQIADEFAVAYHASCGMSRRSACSNAGKIVRQSCTLRVPMPPDEPAQRPSRAEPSSRARLARLEAELDHSREETKRIRAGLRYRIGDALVRAARPSIDTLLLPVRLARLMAEAVGLSIQRSRQSKRRKMPAPSLIARGKAAGGVASELSQLLARPFSEAPSELVRRQEIAVAAVTDEFSWRAWQFEAGLMKFAPDSWRAAFETRRPDLLFVESAWEGYEGKWRGQLIGERYGGAGAGVLAEIVDWCRRRDIPTVFYNKEDPANFDVFLDAARHFDFVFTSDSDCITEYRSELRHDRVFALPFAAQPRIHNPVETEQRDLSVCFAGAWYASRHRSRRDHADVILRPATKFGLDILDRMADSGDPDHEWPDDYKPFVRGGLPYEEMLAAYKRYKVFLNINSVSASPTMFSRRVFELLACGTPVISSFSAGIDALLGDEIVPMSRDEDSTRRLLSSLLEDEDYRDRLSVRGRRKVLSEHTYGRRLQSVLETIGLSPPVSVAPAITMVAAVETGGDVAAAVQNYRRQSYAQKRLVLCSCRDESVSELERAAGDDSSIRVLSRSGVAWPQLLSDAASEQSSGFVAALNLSDWYGPHYLTDYAHATLFIDRAAIGKSRCYRADQPDQPVTLLAGAENQFTDEVVPWTLCLPRSLAVSLAQRVEVAETPAEWWGAMGKLAGRVYAADRFNYVRCGPDDQKVASIPPGQSSFAHDSSVFEAAIA